MRFYLVVLLMLCSCITETSIIKNDKNDTEVANDTNSSVDDTDVSINDNVTGLFELGLRQVACPACVGVSEELTLKMKAEFHQQSSVSHFEWIPEKGTCKESLYPTSLTTTPISIGDKLIVEGNTYEFSLVSTGNGKYEAIQFYEYQYERLQKYTVVIQDPHDSFTFNSLQGFDWIEPYTLLWVDQSYAFDAPIYRSGIEFTWGPSGISDQFMIVIDIFNRTGSQLLGSVSCVGDDSGYLFIPGDYLSKYQKNSLTVVYLKRLQIEKVPVQKMGTNVEVLLEWEVVGTGHIE